MNVYYGPAMATPAKYDDELLKTHLAQAAVNFPGPDYYAVLRWMHAIIKPRTYIEIGVRQGESLRCALPDTLCIAMDPEPGPGISLPENWRIFPVSSDIFFGSQELSRTLHKDSFGLAFIDGLHLFEQALRDFINLERFSKRNSVILIHDCLPLNAKTASRIRTTHFYSGDIWKLCLCLKTERPDLNLTTIKTGPTGLCVVLNPDCNSTVLVSEYQNLIGKYQHLTFKDYLSRRQEMPETIANTMEEVALLLNFQRSVSRKRPVGTGVTKYPSLTTSALSSKKREHTNACAPRRAPTSSG